MNINPFDVFKSLWMIMTSEIGLVIIGLFILNEIFSRITNRRTKKTKRKSEVKEAIFRHKARITGVDATDTMKGASFEKWFGIIWKMGYAGSFKVRPRPRADLILKTKNGERICVQAKKEEADIGVAALGDILRQCIL